MFNECVDPLLWTTRGIDFFFSISLKWRGPLSVGKNRLHGRVTKKHC